MCDTSFFKKIEKFKKIRIDLVNLENMVKFI